MPGDTTDRTDLADADLVGADLHGAWIRESDLRDVRIRGSLLMGAEIDGEIEGLRVNGVEVAPLVEAELDRRHPERAVLRAEDADAWRTGWAGLEAMWAPTMARAAALPEEVLTASVDGEWSFVETLRHLVYATDLWVGGGVLRRERPLHRLALPFTQWREQSADVVDLDATPSYAEVLAVREERVATVRDVLATLNDDRLGEMVPAPPFLDAAEVPVRKCLWVVANEEWHHHRFAVRDLDALEARPRPA